MHGYGKYVWSDQKKYEGQYVDDKKHGYGIYQWPDGRLYKGFWKDGKQHGLAEYQTVNQSAFGQQKDVQSRFGLWQNGRRVKWFNIDKSRSLTEQQKQIEEEVVQELNCSAEEANFHTFRSPMQFFETFASVMVETNKLKQILSTLKEAGMSKQSTLQQTRY